MKKAIMNLVKYNKWLYTLYFHIFSFFLRCMKVFVKPEENLILFNSFGGKKYDDSPKAIYEEMRRDKRFSDYRFVWAFHNPKQFSVEGAETVKVDTLSYFLIALKAKCWITNSTIERGLDFKGKKTFYFNTWHGTPIKKMGTDISSDNQSFSSKAKSKVDRFTAQGDFDVKVFSKVFQIPEEKFLRCGLPRNDVLVNYTQEERVELKKKLGLPLDKKVILYAPTFREFERDTIHGCVLAPPIDLKKWEKELSTEYCLLFRAHYEVAKVMNIEENEFIKNTTLYPALNDLMIVSDILISDYSSIFFDYSVMNKPMFHFTYDYDKYANLRGMYFDIRDFLNGSDNEGELISLLKNLNVENEKSRMAEFRNRYVNYFGSAVKQSLDCIYENICMK